MRGPENRCRHQNWWIQSQLLATRLGYASTAREDQAPSDVVVQEHSAVESMSAAHTVAEQENQAFWPGMMDPQNGSALGTSWNVEPTNRVIKAQGR